jgi:hypothetical protein
MKHLSAFFLIPVIFLFFGCGEGLPVGTEIAELPDESPAETAEAVVVPPQRAEFAAGSKLVIRTMSSISTKSAKSGDSFSASLEEPLVSGTWIVAAKGASVKGVVANSDSGGRVKGVASLSVRLTQVELADGRWVDIETKSYGIQAKSTKKKDAVKVGIASGIGAAIGAIAGAGGGAAKGGAIGAGAGGGVVLATRGDAAVIASESIVTFLLSSDFEVVEQR